MNIGFWNIRGLNKPNKQPEVKWFIHNNKIGLFGLLETRAKALNADRICNSFPNWSYSTNYASHPGGRIWLMWNPGLFVVDILFQSAQLIHCFVIHRGLNRAFTCSFVHGFNEDKM